MSNTALDTTTVRRWKQYSKYIPTAAPWLPTVPAGWQVMKLKHLASSPFQYGANEPGGDTDRNAPRFVRITDIDERGQLRDETYCTLARDKAQPYLLRRGDILLARSGATVGKTFRYQESWGEACYAGYLIRFRPQLDRVLPEFVEYFAASQQYWGWVRQQQLQATIQNLSAEKYANLLLPFPPLPQQRGIVSFLDRETTRIDTLIGHKEWLIALLAEKRQAVINHAVTRGLALGIALKDAGSTFWGQIPSHWRMTKLRHLVPDSRPIMYGIVLPGPHVEDGIPIVKGGNCEPGRLRLEGISRTSREIEAGYERSRLRVGDIVYAIRGSIGAADIVPAELNDANLTQDAARIAIKPGVHPRWLLYTVRSTPFFAKLDAGAIGATIRGINIRDLKRADLPLPAFEEQARIAEYLDCQNEHFDSLAARIADGIARLQEYRSALISAAVTGQIDVRGEVTL